MAEPLTRTQVTRMLFDAYEAHGVLELVIAHNTRAAPDTVAEICAELRDARAKELAAAPTESLPDGDA